MTIPSSGSGFETGGRQYRDMLPENFTWQPRWQYAKGELALVYGKGPVAMLMQRNDGTWYARLECHQPIDAPVVICNCSSFDAGKAGIEAWATRHADRLRAGLSAERTRVNQSVKWKL